MQEPEEVDISRQTVFAGTDSAVAHMSSQYMGLDALDLWKIKPDSIPVWMGEGPVKPHPCPRSYWPLMTVGDREKVCFLRGCGP